MTNQALFSSKDKSKKLKKCRLLQFLFGALRVKMQKYGVFRITEVCCHTSLYNFLRKHLH